MLDPWVGKFPWRRAQQLTPVFLPGESPWTEVPGGLQFKSDVNERISTTQNSTASPLVKLDGWSKGPSYTFFTTFSPLIVIYILSYKHKCI